jgi:hypothetical protein
LIPNSGVAAHFDPEFAVNIDPLFSHRSSELVAIEHSDDGSSLDANVGPNWLNIHRKSTPELQP